MNQHDHREHTHTSTHGPGRHGVVETLPVGKVKDPVWKLLTPLPA